MNTQKHHRNDKLQKSSILFLQLGLVLALFFVYTALEYESIKKEFIVSNEDPFEPPIEITPDVIFILEQPIEEPIKKIPPSKSIIEIIKIEVNQHKIEEVLKDPEPNIQKKINALPGDEFPFDEDVPQPFILIENAPIFPGCEGLVKEASKACFSKEISKFVNSNFDTEIAEKLNLNGKHRIWVQFTIDKEGTVTDIQASSPHKKLEKEAIKVTKALPQMTPGMQRQRPVSVKYTMPIVFQVY